MASRSACVGISGHGRLSSRRLNPAGIRLVLLSIASCVGRRTGLRRLRRLRSSSRPAGGLPWPGLLLLLLGLVLLLSLALDLLRLLRRLSLPRERGTTRRRAGTRPPRSSAAGRAARRALVAVRPPAGRLLLLGLLRGLRRP